MIMFYIWIQFCLKLIFVLGLISGILKLVEIGFLSFVDVFYILGYSFDYILVNWYKNFIFYFKIYVIEL